MDLLIRSNSKGIRYEGYDEEFIQCVFEDANISGRNERYEFRCRPNLECCGRVCCIPEASAIPIWLMVLFIILVILFLSALLGILAWFYRKNKKNYKDLNKENGPKIVSGQNQRALTGYRSYKQNESQEAISTENLVQKNTEDDAYSSPSNIDTQYSKRTKNIGSRNPLFATNTVRTREKLKHAKKGAEYDEAEISTENKKIESQVEAVKEKEASENDENASQKQVNTSGIRMNGYQIAERMPRTVQTSYSIVPSQPYSTRETFEERFEENYLVEEEKTKSDSDTKDFL
ncbi:unnamed protein product [Thelazia callipaeda]|uniref:CX domain-containing protein n=1 Tax=Thelazia callipaeda TaxID=103827 RepID=A0A0N5DCA3_THECL|nr:unnamed protein product [Thelazia callipaeda]